MGLPENIRQITYDDLRRMYTENQRDAIECEQVTQSTYRGESYYTDDERPGIGKIQHPRHALYKEVLFRDIKTNGFMMGYPHGVVIRQGERRHYYRGETEIYEKSGTTLSRELNKTDRYKSDEDKRLYRLVADMRIAEFEHFIRRFYRTSCWDEKGLTVLTEPLAQHYGLQTDWLDVTNDFNTALFFSTCYWSHDDKKWYPLTRKQTEGDNEKKKFGVLFCAPGWRITMNNACHLVTDKDEGMIFPIGYQPFMRCHSQYGYGLHMRNSISLQENSTFEWMCFRHSEALSKAVYELMDSGRKVYPEEGLDEFQDILDAIATATSFSEAAFLAALKKNELDSRADEYRVKLEHFNVMIEHKTEHGIELEPKQVSICGDQHPFTLSRQRIRRANRKDRCFSIENYYHIQLNTRFVCYGERMSL